MKGPVLRTLSVLALTAGLVGLPQAAFAAGPRIDLKVLVVTDGGPNTLAMAEQLKTEGVPYRLVDLNDPARPVITTAFLQDTVSGAARAKYQAVVLPNSNPFSNAAEMAAIVGFEKQFGIRQLSAYVYPTAEHGLSAQTAGPLDGATPTLTAAAKAGAFRYLKGTVPFEDNDPNLHGETYGYTADPLPDGQGTHFEPYMLHNNGKVIAGVYTHDTRNEMVLTFSANHNQTQFRALGHGLVTWLTKGVHLGYNRSYLSVHVDDLFAKDARWSVENDCTPTENCAPGITTPDIRMNAADVTAAVGWQTSRNFTFDMYFNGFGSDEQVEETGSDPLLTAVQANKAKLRFANHTFMHTYLGCQQDFTVSPWACKKDINGNTLWESRAYVRNEIEDNWFWSLNKNLTTERDELVTGEHSGLKILPQQPQDNPNLAGALQDTQIKWVGSDASRDFDQRQVGNALTVPRYPMANYFNVGTAAEMVDEYNWIYTSRANGGSGICEDNPGTVTCITPLDPATGYQNHIVPLDTRIAMTHMLRNDPRPHYVHQSNMAEERILYPLLDSILGAYRNMYADNSPLVNKRMRDNGAEMKRQNSWKSIQGGVTAYLQDGKVTISGVPSGTIPITMPEGTKDTTGLLCGLLCGILGAPAFGDTYGGERSSWKTGNTTLQVGATTV